MRILISYFLENSKAWDGTCGSNFPNIESAWEWFESMSRDAILYNGAKREAVYTHVKAHTLEDLYNAATCNMGMGSVVAKTMVDDEDSKKHLADVRVRIVQ